MEKPTTFPVANVNTEAQYKSLSQGHFDIEAVPYLPFEKTLKASCIATREEVRISTGTYINLIQNGNQLLVSKELYEKIKSTTNKDKRR